MLVRRNSFWDSIPLSENDPRVQESARMKLQEKLKERNEVKCGDWYLVRIPRIEGRIFINRKSEYSSDVEYLYERWYDKEKKQTRNRKVKIGIIIKEYPKAMVPNEQYYEYFDRETGELKAVAEEHKTEAEEENKPAETAPINQEQTEQEEAETADHTGLTVSEAVLPDQQESTEMDADSEEAATEDEQDTRDSAIEEALRGVHEEAERIRQARAKERDRQNLAKEMLQLIVDSDKVSSLALDKDDELKGLDEGREDLSELEREIERTKWLKERFQILSQIVREIQTSIRTQAKKYPDVMISTYKAQKINKLLAEVQEREKRMGMADLLELIPEPQEVEKNGKTIMVGMTYSDVEILLDHYTEVMSYTSFDQKLYTN